MTRHLYTPTGISFDAQREHANRLINNEVEDEVVVHVHGTDGTCTSDCLKSVADLRGDHLGPESSSVGVES